jgi:hypothetical protein
MFEEDDAGLRQQFEQLMRGMLPSRLITNFIIVAEVVDGDSSELSVSVSGGMSPWLASGMLEHAANIISTGESRSQDDED